MQAREPAWASESVGMEWAPEDTLEIRLAAECGRGSGRRGRRGKKGLEPPMALLDRANATGMLLGNAWDSRLDMRPPGASEGAAALRPWPPEDEEEDEDTTVVGVASMWGMPDDCMVVGEALRLEFLLLMAEKSMRSSLLDSSCSSLGARKEPARPGVPAERMWRRSCLRLCEVIWLVEVKVKPCHVSYNYLNGGR